MPLQNSFQMSKFEGLDSTPPPLHKKVDVDALKAAVSIVDVVASYVTLKKRGAEFVGLCPFHADKNPSLWIVPAKRMYHCFSCGASGDVLDFVQNIEGVDFKEACKRLGAPDTKWEPRLPIKQEAAPRPDRVTSKPPADAGVPDMQMRSLGEPSRTWCYRDADELPLGYIARYETGAGKEIRAWTWGARGEEKPAWGCAHWSKPRPLYGLDRLAAKPAAPVLLVEGEKAADAAQTLLPQYVAATWPGGAQAWKHADLEPLRGRRVDLWPDADEPGREAMQAISRLLADSRGLACYGKLIDPRGLVDGGDAADWPSGEDPIPWLRERSTWYAKRNVAPQPDSLPISSNDGGRGIATAVGAAPNPAPQGVLPPPSSSTSSGAVDPAAAGLPKDAPEPPVEPPPPLEAYAAEPTAQRAPRTTAAKRRAHLAVVEGNAARAPDPDAAPLPQAMSEDALADSFAAQHGEDWRYVKRWDKWFKWDAVGWIDDETAEVFTVARELCRAAAYWPDAASLTPIAKRQLGQRRVAGNVRDMAGADRRIAATADQWDRDPWLLGVPGGVIDLKNSKLLESDREHYITKRTSVSPERGEHPLWDKVLARASGGDATMLHYLSKWAGYMLTGDTREEAFLFVHGPGGSGKSTFVQVLRDCMGSYAKATRIETFMSTRHGEHPTEIADLAGARLVSAPETEEGSRWNEGRIKMLTGHDKVKARFMNKDYFEFDPVCKIMIFGNHRPRLHSVGEEMKRRIHMVEFRETIPVEERDNLLKTAICAEYPAILQWMIDGCMEWQAEGLGRPEAVSQATDDYLSSQDTLGSWLEECCDRDPNSRCMVSGAYRNFETWAKARGEYVPSVTVFSEKMQARGFTKRKVSVMYFLGLALKTTDAPQAGYYPDA